MTHRNGGALPDGGGPGRRRLSWLLAGSVVALAAACEHRAPEAGTQPAARLTGTEWVVEDIAGRGIVDYSRMTLNFGADGRLSGRASCNSYNGSYTLSDGTLEIGRIAVTRRACPPALMNQEAAFLRVLGDARRTEITGNGALRLVTLEGDAIEARR